MTVPEGSAVPGAPAGTEPLPQAASPRAWRATEAWFFAGFALAIGVFLAMALTIHRTSREIAESARWVLHSHDIIANLDSVLNAVVTQETRQRAYLLSGDLEFLQRYTDSIAMVDELMRALEAGTADNPRQQAPVATLRRQVAARQDSLLKMALDRAGRPVELAVLQAGAGVMDDIRASVAAVRAEEERVLAARTADAAAASTRNQQVIVYGTAAGMLLLLGAAGMFVHGSRVRRRSEADRERFFTLSLDLLCIAGLDGRFKRLNPAFTETLGWTGEELLARPFIEFVHPDDVAATHAEVARLARGESTLDFENRYRCKDGSWKWLRWKARAFPSERLLYATARDVTAQKEDAARLADASEAARAANHAKSVFLATMSHEIRTPMNGVLGLLELLSLTPLNAEQRNTLAVIRDSGLSLQRIIDDILDFSKIEAGKLDLRPEAVSIAELVEAVHRMYSGNASSKGLTLRHSADPRLSPALRADPMRLRQILGNFVSNAIKFTAQGEIEIRAELLETRDGIERVRFSVSDTGVGISPEDQARLFQPFHQALRETIRGAGGTGLGLAICRRLADLMGGTVALDSALGRGTTLTLVVDLPVADPAELARAPETAGPLAESMPPARGVPSIAQAQRDGTLILLADDHPTNRMVLLRQLNTLGYAAEAAVDGNEALRLWQSGRFALLIADCHMPGLSGYDLARRIRQLEDGSTTRTPIIACTANALRDDAAKCYAAGMDDYLAKPVQLGPLREKMSQWLPLATGAADDPIDPAVLAEITNGDPDTARQFTRDFEQVCAEDGRRLRDAAARDDLVEVARMSHRMKGASQMVGARDLAHVCEQIEQAARANDRPGVDATLPALERQLGRLAGFFDGQ